MCRSNITNIKKNENVKEITKYKNNDYVWIFGYFTNLFNPSNNDIIFNNSMSGYLWTLYSNENIKQFENDISLGKDVININIGLKDYIIDLKNDYCKNDNINGYIQKLNTNTLNKIRPVMRLKYKDLIKYKFIIAEDDDILFDKVYFKKLDGNLIDVYNFKRQIKLNTKNSNKQNISIDELKKKYIRLIY
jgi:hypothetical protein